MSEPEQLDAAAVERVVIDALIHAPDTELIDTPSWVQLRTPSVRDNNVNGVYVAKLAAADADAHVEAVMREHAERGAGFRWFVGPSSSPADLPERLRRAGMHLLGHALGMSMRVPSEVPAVASNIELRPVGPGEIEAFARLSMRAWERELDFVEPLERALRRAMARDDDPQRSWIVLADGEPAGTTTLRLLRGRPWIGYLQGAAVVAKRRGAGIYRAMLHHRLALLRELGFEHALIWADERSSARSAQRVGLEPRCRGAFFEWPRPPGHAA